MLNQAQIIGRVGQDPEIRYVPSGDAVVNFSLATTDRWKDKNTGEQKETTEWHRVNAFGKLAEIIGQYVKKGALIYVSGKIATRKYQDKDGIERQNTEIKITEMKMLGGKSDEQNERQSQRPAQTQRPAPPPSQGSGFDDMYDDIPY